MTTVSETPETEPTEVQVEESTAQADLDTLLSEYSEPETPATTPEPAPTVSPEEVAEFRQMLDSNRVTQLNAGLDDSAASIKAAAGEVASNIPNWIFRGAIRDYATEHPVTEKIFLERASNPEAWNKVKVALGKKIADDLTSTDQASTDSWNAVDGAMHSASTSTPKPKTDVSSKDLSNMSDSEFAAHKKAQGY